MCGTFVDSVLKKNATELTGVGPFTRGRISRRACQQWLTRDEVLSQDNFRAFTSKLILPGRQHLALGAAFLVRSISEVILVRRFTNDEEWHAARETVETKKVR